MWDSCWRTAEHEGRLSIAIQKDTATAGTLDVATGTVTYHHVPPWATQTFVQASVLLHPWPFCWSCSTRTIPGLHPDWIQRGIAHSYCNPTERRLLCFSESRPVLFDEVVSADTEQLSVSKIQNTMPVHPMYCPRRVRKANIHSPVTRLPQHSRQCIQLHLYKQV